MGNTEWRISWQLKQKKKRERISGGQAYSLPQERTSRLMGEAKAREAFAATRGMGYGVRLLHDSPSNAETAIPFRFIEEEVGWAKWCSTCKVVTDHNRRDHHAKRRATK